MKSRNCSFALSGRPPPTRRTGRSSDASRARAPVELPWLDVERAVFIAVNRHIGDDLGIALDYRTGTDDPRVAASDWSSGDGCLWREVTPRFSEFVERLGLDG
jgi:hypothetical protein